MSNANYDELLVQYTIVEKYHRHILWVVLALLFAMDIFTTSVSLQNGNIEKNPVMIPFAGNPFLHGIIKISAYILLFVIIENAVRFIEKKRPEKKPFWIKLNFQALYGIIIFALVSLIWLYFYVLVHNLAVIS